MTSILCGSVPYPSLAMICGSSTVVRIPGGRRLPRSGGSSASCARGALSSTAKFRWRQSYVTLEGEREVARTLETGFERNLLDEPVGCAAKSHVSIPNSRVKSGRSVRSKAPSRLLGSRGRGETGAPPPACLEPALHPAARTVPISRTLALRYREHGLLPSHVLATAPRTKRHV